MISRHRNLIPTTKIKIGKAMSKREMKNSFSTSKCSTKNSFITIMKQYKSFYYCKNYMLGANIYPYIPMST